MRVLVTGATGFVGSAFVRRLLNEGEHSARAAIRHPLGEVSSAWPDVVTIGDLSANTDWGIALRDIDVVVHTAAHVHVPIGNVAHSLAEFRRANVDGTKALARQALEAGVRRFVFVSSIKVNGEQTTTHPFTATDRPNPLDAYAVSKLEAEKLLLRIAKESNMEVVIVRPPLVYGPGVGGNFLSMMQWLKRGVPLPLGAVKNRRSLIGVDNLVDLLKTCTHHRSAAGEIFLASDGIDISTTELLRKLGDAMAQRALLIPIPHDFLVFGMRVGGLGRIAQRLCGNLQVDSSATAQKLGWNPPIDLEAGLQRTAQYWLGGQQ